MAGGKAGGTGGKGGADAFRLGRDVVVAVRQADIGSGKEREASVDLDQKIELRGELRVRPVELPHGRGGIAEVALDRCGGVNPALGTCRGVLCMRARILRLDCRGQDFTARFSGSCKGVRLIAAGIVSPAMTRA